MTRNLFVATGIAAAAVGLAAPATADAYSDSELAYLQILTDRGSVGAPPDRLEDLVMEGKALCDVLDQRDFAPETLAGAEANRLNVSRSDAWYFMGAATATFCPWHDLA